MQEKPFTVLFVPAGRRLSPATRYRIYQFLPFLDQEGIKYEIYSIISEKTTSRMIQSVTYTKGERFFYYLQIFFEKFLRSWRVIVLAGEANVVFLQRATFLFGMEKLIQWRNKNIIFDIDDAIYIPDKEEKGLIGWIKKKLKKLEVVSVLKVSRSVVVENNHIKKFVEQYCDDVHCITGPIDTEKNYVKQYQKENEEVVIGWIGSPSTTGYLKMLDDVFKQLSKKHSLRILLIGAGSYSLEGVTVEHVPWTEETEVEQLHRFDIGVMSMPDNEWTRGKVGCKMLQYMVNGIPSVVSYTPTNAEIITDAANGFLAASTEEWIEKLSILIEDSPLRKTIGLAGRKTVEDRFSIQINAPKMIQILKGMNTR